MARRTILGASCLTLLTALVAGGVAFAQSTFPPPSPGAYPVTPGAVDPRAYGSPQPQSGLWGAPANTNGGASPPARFPGQPGAYGAPAMNPAPLTRTPPAQPSSFPATDGYTPYYGPAGGNPASAAAPPFAGSPALPPYAPSAAAPGVGAPNYAPGPMSASYAPGAAQPGGSVNRPVTFGPPPPPRPVAAPYMANLPTPGQNANPAAAPMAGSMAPPGAAVAPPDRAPTPRPETPPPVGELFEPAQVVAVVGDERILAGDILAQVNQFIELNREKIPPGREEYYRDRLMQQVLENEIQTKLVYLDFLRQIRSKGAGQEKITEIHNRVYEQFDEKRLPDLMEKAKVTSPAELDAKMREQGSSLMKHKRQFAEKVMSQQWIRDTDKVNYEPIVTHAQMLDYYYAHVEEDYAHSAKARWEHLMAEWDKFPTKAAAYEAIRAMGNEVYLGGAPLWAVAKRSSHGVTASDGGQYDWTTQGSLKSKVLDQAIFELPLKQLSPILEDEEGLHIVRVLERQEAGRTSFETAQSEIKEKIKKQEVQKQVDAFLAGLRKNTPVWTIFDKEKEERAAEEAARTSSFGDKPR